MFRELFRKASQGGTKFPQYYHSEAESKNLHERLDKVNGISREVPSLLRDDKFEERLYKEQQE
ncbi:hypothetical protein EAG11_09980 [Flavobacterium sp. 140616W15]|nr:hypothetical protein EAG11_09980 [Flavobacterium sp. 140616W15]